jgi:hypothetical protein
MQAPKSSTEIAKPQKRKKTLLKRNKLEMLPQKILTVIAEPTHTHKTLLEGSKLEPY